ncbi:MAG: hypothetical protein KDC38_07185 [Planctomycetes bacterium]|nr:hypothetical protein [Planctomycetota bacterium]
MRAMYATRPRTTVTITGALLVLLGILHSRREVEVWTGPWFDARTALFGWLPAEIAYHLGYVAVATVIVYLLLRLYWRSDP